MIREYFNQLKYEYQNFLWHKNRQNRSEARAKLFYDTHYESWSIDQNSVFYDVQDGDDLDDSPLAILKYWLSNDLKMKHIIVTKIKSRDKIVNILNFWQLDDERISIVDYQSIDHMKALLTSKYIVTNTMIFSDIFVKRVGQVYVNTWHGTPLKKMGYAMPGGVMGSWNVIRTVMMTDYLVMPNDYTAEIFKRDYRLNGLYSGQFIMTGYPRNDVLINHLPQHQMSILKHTLGVNHKKNKIILYAPTWSGDTTKITSNIKELDAYLNVLKKISELKNVEVKFKPHPYFKPEIDRDKRFDPYRLNDFIGTNALLSEVDILITDYSSLFFDFLVSNHPIVFFDIKENYSQERGEYIDVTSLPGPYTKDSNELIALLKNTEEWFSGYHLVYEQFKTKFVSRDDGLASQRVVQEVANRPIARKLPRKTILVNGEDFSDTSFSDTNLVMTLHKSYDVSMAIFESHLLDNWYGQLFFKHIDEVMPVSRIFVNKYVNYPEVMDAGLAQILGRRVTGNKIFNILIILQPDFSKHQQILMTTAKTIIMKKNAIRERWLIELGFTKNQENQNFQVWQDSTKTLQKDVLDILEKLATN